MTDHQPLPIAVSVANESGAACDLEALRRLAGYLFGALGLHPDCELAITLVTPERMTELHVDWMHEPGPTDVLSFPMDELRSAAPGTEPVPGVLGDIVICPGYLGPQSLAAGRTLDEELAFLTTHGTLHLIGYDHSSPADYDAMFALQDELLSGWRAS